MKKKTPQKYIAHFSKISEIFSTALLEVNIPKSYILHNLAYTANIYSF